ncbi:hypothetical protein EVAR_53904_1 [Eumeta japonica]|uniref:Uncharacterized protein n=1 Tax=Eumeta variegata TaxID=151549 RepID=A0A4C1YGK9_EUMVA|nr:hypothetical protein EVAR_53904_1 [Eumeta japonica]
MKLTVSARAARRDREVTLDLSVCVALIGFLSISTSWAKKVEDPKGKREAPTGYTSGGHAGHTIQIQPSLGHEDGASAISIGAGYSVGGAKGGFGFGGHGLQLETSDGHNAIQLPAITLQPDHGGLVSGDLSQLMSQISHGISSGAIPLQASEGSYHASLGGQELSLPQYTYGAPKLAQYTVGEQSVASVPSYAAGTKGLGSYATGPVLFNPADSHSAAALTYSAPSSGHSLGDVGGYTLGGSGHSLGGAGISLGGSGHSLGGAKFTLGSSGHSFGSGLSLGGGAGHSLGGSGHILGGSGHSFGGVGQSLGGTGHSLGGSLGGSPYKLSGGYGAPSKTFKPSAFLGASVQSDSTHGLSGLSSSYGSPSFGHSFSGGSGHGGAELSSGGHRFGGSFGSGSSKFVSPAYLPSKSEGFGSSLESVSAFSSNGHLSGSYGHPSNNHGSSSSPQYYVTSLKQSSPSQSSFGEGSSTFRGASHGPSSFHSSGPKYSYSESGHGSRYSPKDSHGAYSETSYNTIKYSEELKPRAH